MVHVCFKKRREKNSKISKINICFRKERRGKPKNRLLDVVKYDWEEDCGKSEIQFNGS